jgi:hypothetical protein
MTRCTPAAPRRSIPAFLLLVAVGALAMTVRAHAQPVPTISGAPQIFVQRGQAVDITLSGKALASVETLALTRARGVQIALVPADGKNSTPGKLHLHVSADPEAALGDRELRLIGPTGVSAPLRVMVGQYPEFVEKEPNNTPEQAQDIVFPVSLAGKIETPGDIDCFRFGAARGQTLVFDVHATRSRSQLDPLLTIHNEAGRELKTKVDLYGGDPVVVFEVPADGRYILSVRDLQYRGGEEFTYHIDAGPIPYVQSVLPMSGQPGKMTRVTPTGVNLTGVSEIPLDLTYAAEGEIAVRARASAGVSNPIRVAVNDLPAFADEKTGHSAQAAVAVPIPVDISSRINLAGDENYYRFHLASKQLVTLESICRRMGSPLEAMLTLRDSTGRPMQSSDSAGGSDASITRDLPAGDYLVSIRDLFYAGGPRYAYRLQIRPGGTSGAGSQDFAVRFLPDAPRISRGGNMVVFVDLKRKGGFADDVTITLDNLPTGVTCPPLVMNDKLPGASGVLTFSAAPDAQLGSFPIRLRAVAMIGSSPVVHDGLALLDGREVEQAYLTVLDAAPVKIEAIASLTDQRTQQLATETDALAAKLAQPNAQIQAAEAEWEKKFATPVQWTPLKDAKIASLSGTEFTTLEDGSILAGKTSPERDTYTITANTGLAAITAIRLETLTDPSLPAKGPGRAVTGNFVLSQFTVAVSPRGDAAKSTPVILRSPVAEFEQAGFPVINVLTAKPGKGWGISPRKGESIQAVFFTAIPTGGGKGSVLTFTLDQQFGQQNTLGRFRISLTDDPQAIAKASVPTKILKLLALPMDQRKAADKAQILAYYKTIDPQAAVDSARLAALRNEAGARIEIARLEKLLATDSPEIARARSEWEKSVLAGSQWLPLDLSTVKSSAGATLTKEQDESVLVSGPNSSNDTYTLVTTTPFKEITALRIEALPDARLPAFGPGRAPDGNFLLSKVLLFRSHDDEKAMKEPVEFESAAASAEQAGHTAASLLTSAKDAGWSLPPGAGRPAVLTLRAREKFSARDASGLTIVLEQKSPQAQHTLGRFRIWATSNPNPDAVAPLPASIMAILKKTADKRSDRQKKELIAWYRDNAPSLAAARYRLAELQAQMESGLTLSRGTKISIPFLLDRANFKGDAKVSLSGFIAGRDPLTGAPTTITKALKFDPLDVPANKSAGRLNIEAQGLPEVGPRFAVLEVQTGSGDTMRVEYSAPFVLTVVGK